MVLWIRTSIGDSAMMVVYWPAVPLGTFVMKLGKPTYKPLRTTSVLPPAILPTAKPMVFQGLLIEPIPVVSFPVVDTKLAVAGTKITTTEQNPLIGVVVYMVPASVPPHVPLITAIKLALGVTVKVVAVPQLTI